MEEILLQFPQVRDGLAILGTVVVAASLVVPVIKRVIPGEEDDEFFDELAESKVGRILSQFKRFSLF